MKSPAVRGGRARPPFIGTAINVPNPLIGMKINLLKSKYIP